MLTDEEAAANRLIANAVRLLLEPLSFDEALDGSEMVELANAIADATPHTDAATADITTQLETACTEWSTQQMLISELRAAASPTGVLFSAEEAKAALAVLKHGASARRLRALQGLPPEALDLRPIEATRAIQRLHSLAAARGKTLGRCLSQAHPSALGLDLDREIRALRDSGWLFGLISVTSDAARDRVAPHLKAPASGEGAPAMAQILGAVKTGQQELQRLNSEWETGPAWTRWVMPDLHKPISQTRSGVLRWLLQARADGTIDDVGTALLMDSRTRRFLATAPAQAISERVRDATAEPPPDEAVARMVAGLAIPETTSMEAVVQWRELMLSSAAPLARAVLSTRVAQHDATVRRAVDAAVERARSPLGPADPGRPRLYQPLYDATADVGGNGEVHIEGASSDLLNAVATSVMAGERELDLLDDTVHELVDALRAADARLRHAPSADGDPSSPFHAISSDAADALLQRISASRHMLSTFNIAFFGRTGVGKSTLMSALGRLDGGRVSPGDSDWTTEVEAIDWNGCRLFDTPGTGGWGRTRTRSDLEEAARQAVETADVVLLCFDSQSQQQAEFEKVAAWVQEYGKPAIAVLNFRNDRWRHPARTHELESRRALAATLRQHVENITAELGRIGLPQVPVVALNSKRALVARATRPFRGPGAPAVEGELAAFGAGYLERWSNITVLEQLVSACLVVGGTDLRLASLREGMRSTFRDWSVGLSEVSERMVEHTSVLERAIGQMLDILGYPDLEHRHKHFGAAGATDTDLLTHLEKTREEAFDAKIAGRLTSHCRHLLRSHLGEERARSLRRAEELIISAFDERRQVEEAEFERTVYRQDVVASAVQHVTLEVNTFLSGHLRLSGIDAQQDLKILEQRATEVVGRTGTRARTIGIMLEAGGILTGGASAVLGAIALTNFWNPAGWTAAAVLGGLTIASALAGFLGRRSRRSGEKERVQERARAIGEARRVVAAQFDTWEETQLQRVVTDAWAQSADTLKGLVQQSVTNRESNSELTLISAKLEKKARDIPHAPPSADVIGRGVELVVGSSSSRSETEILLGEDWLDFEVPPADRVFLSKRDKTAFRQKSDGDRGRLEDFLHAATGGLRLNDIQRFLTQASSSGCLDEDNAAVLHELSNNFGRPRIALIGDYSAGKTSLIKRLLADSGDEVPNTLVVHAGPATSSATGYRYGSFDLVDLPGFQGHNGAHDETAVLEARDAGLIMILLNTNLLLGDTSALREVLLGSARVAAKAGRCIFVIGRIDDIGVDPESAPRDFISRCRRKEAELLSALRASGFPIHSNQIFSLAADPFGMVGNRAPVSAGSYLERHRLWDGVRTIADPLLAQHPTQALKMSAAGALDSALSILTVTREAQRHAVEELEGERADALAMEGALEDALSELRLLQRALTQRCQLVVEEHANEMIAEALGAGPSEASAIAETLAKWWRDPRLDTAVEQFMTAAERDIREWQENNDSVIDRKLLRIAARVNLSSTSGEVPPTSSGGDRLASTVLQQASRIVSGFGSRDAVYRVGKSFRYKFKPWGAVKGGVRVARIGVALGFVAVTFDTIAFIRDLKAEDGRESARHRAAEQVRDTAPQVIDQILRGTEDGPSGPLTYLDAQEQTLREALEALARRRATVSEAIATVQTQTGTLDKIFTDARKLDTRRPEEQR